MTALSGSNVSLQIHNLPKNYQQLTWFYTTNQKIVEWEFNKTNYFNFKFKDRVMLDHQSFALYIYKVQKEDSSTYLVRVLKEAGDEEEWKVTLQVFGESGEPEGRSSLWSLRWAIGGLLWEKSKTSGQA